MSTSARCYETQPRSRRSPGARLLPMVKADAYGLGAVRVARALERLDPWGFGVATIAEGEELRGAGIARPIVVFTPVLAGDFDAAIRADLTPSLGDRESIERWQLIERPWHLAIDTGMSRAGVQWNEIGADSRVLPHHPPQGAFTHFHSAERNDEHARRAGAAVRRRARARFRASGGAARREQRRRSSIAGRRRGHRAPGRVSLRRGQRQLAGHRARSRS